ncbi:hypothetical protein B5M09_002977 [Aphanomyces astaci]|uniref:PI3K/PI4K catalytic domain-containing protein n=1 Tax=Aphanomyces astaci TaxID=112090 RepID=A0A3R7WFZ1_APHAT|nr:hypothetical protein B5M09_002977 [Aphanomyces astaci]
MISIWKHRKNVAFTNSLCDELSKLTNTRPILDQVDFYLPQLSHMVLHLEKELPMEAMEQFVMLLSLSSSHFALQFFWIVYGALDEHRPKKNGNPRTFTRCAQLLVILEQCFIYGSPVNKQAKNADSGKEHEVSKAAPVVDPPSTEQHNDIFVAEKVAGGIGTPQDNSSIRNARTSSGSAPVHLTSDEQMRYDFFTAQISFVKAITDICEDLRLVDVSKRKELLPTKLTRLHETLPKYAYLPLCRSTDHFYHVAAVCAQEGYVFKTHERAPVLMHFLTTPNSANMDVSCALFAHLHAQDEHIDTVKCNAPVLNESTPFIDELLMVRQFYDDLRQEVLVMQLISYLDDVFKREHLKLKLHPYRILSTGASTGLIELVANATSFDGLKKSPGFKSLRNHFESIYGATNSTMFHTASSNFVQSLVLGRAPGGSFSFETAPFKLTMEMVECMGGKDSANFKTFTDLCIQAAVAARRHGETLYTLVEVMSFHSKLPCFSGIIISKMLLLTTFFSAFVTNVVTIVVILGNVTATLQAFRDRLFLNVPEDKVGRVVEGLIHKAFDNFGTAKYDQFQEYSNGIAK